MYPLLRAYAHSLRLWGERHAADRSTLRTPFHMAGKEQEDTTRYCSPVAKMPFFALQHPLSRLLDYCKLTFILPATQFGHHTRLVIFLTVHRHSCSSYDDTTLPSICPHTGVNTRCRSTPENLYTAGNPTQTRQRLFGDIAPVYDEVTPPACAHAERIPSPKLPKQTGGNAVLICPLLFLQCVPPQIADGDHT